MTANQHNEAERMTHSRWVWFVDHVGRITGLVLALLVFCFMVFLVIAGYRPALYVILFFVAGIAMIAFGGRIHRL